jgi:hypothetical protein
MAIGAVVELPGVNRLLVEAREHLADEVERVGVDVVEGI